MKGGHSNVEPKQTRQWSDLDKTVESGIARIPISGGVTAATTRDFPPLSLMKEEWLEIGRRMGWINSIHPQENMTITREEAATILDMFGCVYFEGGFTDKARDVVLRIFEAFPDLRDLKDDDGLPEHSYLLN